jgi:hypothetical protein
MPTAPKVTAKSAKAKAKDNKTTASTKKALAKGGRRAGAQNFSIEDKEYLISLLEEVGPLGPEQWENIVSRYNSDYAKPNEPSIQDKEGLRQQWYKMTKVSKPTGDPSCPEYIRRAKRVNKEIHNEIAMTGIDDDALTDSELEEDEPEEDDIEDEDKDNSGDENADKDKNRSRDEEGVADKEKLDDDQESAVLIRGDSDDENNVLITSSVGNSDDETTTAKPRASESTKAKTVQETASKSVKKVNHTKGKYLQSAS